MKRSSQIGLLTCTLLLGLGIFGASCGKKTPPPSTEGTVVETHAVAPDSVAPRQEVSGTAAILKPTTAGSRAPGSVGEHVSATVVPRPIGVTPHPVQRVETPAPAAPATSPPPAPIPATAPPPAKSAEGAGGLDAGPRAADAPVDAALASRGKALFTQKACNTCHQMSTRLVGPALGPVPKQRSAAWIMAMIERPAEMTRTDPIAKQLLQDYKIQMLLPHAVNAEEARALLEFMKSGGK